MCSFSKCNSSKTIRSYVRTKQQKKKIDGRQQACINKASFIIDSYLQFSQKSLLFGVFDGHGGSIVSTYIQKNLPSIVKDVCKKTKNNIKTTIEKAFVQMNQKIRSSISRAEQSGSTGTLGLILLEDSKRVLYIGHVGDSSAYIFDDNGCQKITYQHRCNNPEEITRIKNHGGKIINNRVFGMLAVTRAFGDFTLQSHGVTAFPQVCKIEIKTSNKYIVVASDGLWDFVQLKKIYKIVNSETKAQDICKMLIKTAIQSGSNDNITVIVIKL